MRSELQDKVFNECNARWNILTGAVSSGKTFLTYDLLPIRMREAPPGACLLIGKTERTLKRNILDPLRERYPGKYVSRVYGDGEVNLFGRKCYIAGANDAKAVSKIQGITLAYAYGDEVTTWSEDVFMMLQSRLRVPGAMFDGTCNPDSPSHWLKAFIDNPKMDVKSWKFKLDDNPFLDPKYVADLKAGYTGLWYKRYILGEWCLADGIIYPMFSESTHVCSVGGVFDKHYISVDYGTMNPTAAILWGYKGGIWYAIDEYYYDGRKRVPRTDEEHYKAIEALAGDRNIASIIVDPSAASLMAVIHKHRKYMVQKANNDVLDGIRETANCLTKRIVKINKVCYNVIKEFGLYSWNDKKTYDEPIKDNDHAMDAIRYFVRTADITHRNKRK